MRAVILAAGMATRLRPLTDSTPKCLLEVDGRAILGRAIDELSAAGLDRLIIVTGYRAEMIRAYLAREFPRLAVSFAHNERFAETNNAYSLLLAEPLVGGGPFLLLDSDILFPAELVRRVLDTTARPALALDRHTCSEEEMKVEVDGRGFVRDIGKDLVPARAAGESIGVEAFGAEDGRELFATLRKRIVDEKRENEFYEASFREMIKAGRLYLAVDTTDCPAMEIDSAEDLKRAQSLASTGAKA
jgi:choline kinase